MNKQKKRRLLIIYTVTVILLFLFFVIPLPYYSIFPGETINMGEVVLFDNKDVLSNEHFFAVSVNIYENPYSHKIGLTKNSFKVNFFIFIISKLSAVVELNEFPIGYENITSDEIKNYNYALLNESQKVALNLALEYLDINKTDVNISFGSLAGSSGSLATALEIIQQLGDRDLIKEKRIAVTGELAPEISKI